MAEALFRPSNADRWMVCIGSTALCRGVKSRPGGPAAREGTAAHKVLEDALKGGPTPEEMVDRAVEVDGHRIDVDQEMAEGVRLFLTEVEKRAGPTTQVLSEQYMSLQPLGDDPLLNENRGTGDCVILDFAARRLTIMDLKYGKRFVVDGDARQLKDYAVLALLNHPVEGGWREVETVVVQPRLPHEDDRVKAFLFDPVDLYEFGFQIVQAMQAAMQVNAPLTPGEKQCRWCAAKDDNRCPAIARQAVEILWPALPPDPSPITALTPYPVLAELPTTNLPDPVGMTDEERAFVLDRSSVWDTWITAVKQSSVGRLEVAPGCIKNWKLVKRTGNRKWTDPEAAAVALRAAGMQTSAMYTDPKLKTPKQIEDSLPKEKRGIIEGLVSRPEGATTLVRDTDPRQSLPGMFASAPALT